MNAHCQCKAITFKTSLPAPLKIHFCHYLECRHQSSSAFGISAIFPASDLPQSEHLGCWTKHHDPNDNIRRYFCKICGSRLVDIDGEDAFVKGGCLEGLSREMLKDAAHIWTKRAVVDIPEGAERYEEGYPESGAPEK